MASKKVSVKKPAKKSGAKQAAARKTPAKKAARKQGTKKAAVRTAVATATAPAGRHVTIRMYNVGFGDAFLLILPGTDRPRKVLFDCGSIEASPGLSMSSIVDRIVSDVTESDGIPKIDVVVATHRHKDHVSGFGDTAWDSVEVNEVWMPWTEHPTDPDAREIREIQSRLALALDASLRLKAESLGARRNEIARYQDVVANSLMLSNDKAMKTLHSGFAGDPVKRFLPLKSGEIRTLVTDVLPGVRIHVLGPSRDREVIRDMDPPQGESFLRLSSAANIETGLPPAPFSAEFRMADYSGYGTLPPEDLPAIEMAGSMSDLAVAVALDKAVNGTSLMLVLEISGTYLLFPGDAQWGTWNAAMTDPEWQEILGRVSFYKVGHHGSHNATPVHFVKEIIPDGVCAMASTLTRNVWPEIPKFELLNELLNKHATIARSDEPDAIEAPFGIDQGVIETHIAL